MEHSILPVSGASTWTPCPGSIVLSLGIPDEETDDNREGTAVHAISAHMLKGCMRQASGYIGQTSSNGVVITEEMAKYAEMYVSYVFDHTPKHAELHVEERILCQRIHDVCWGTPDMWAFDDSTGTVYLRDYKHGHRSVDAYWNDQFIGYASGIMDQLPIVDTAVTFVFEVIQPRCYDGKGMVRGWRVNGAELRGRINQMNAAAHEALGPEPKTHAGAYCRDCVARIRCNTHQQFGMDAVDYAHTAAPIEISDAALAYEWSVIERASAALKYRREAIENEALSRMRAGRALLGLSKKQSMGHRRWIATDADVIAMGDAMNVDLRAPQQAVSPTKAREAVKAANLPATVLNGLDERPTGNVSVVIDDDAVIRSQFTEEVYYK